MDRQATIRGNEREAGDDSESGWAPRELGPKGWAEREDALRRRGPGAAPGRRSRRGRAASKAAGAQPGRAKGAKSKALSPAGAKAKAPSLAGAKAKVLSPAGAKAKAPSPAGAKAKAPSPAGAKVLRIASVILARAGRAEARQALREAGAGALRASVRGGAGHAAHFLSRLDRVGRDEADFALGLYRDPGLVRFLLARVALPEGRDRAAISLDDPREGPFLVVTRAGHFVTCLGRGMSPGDLPVVPREKLAAALTVASEQRARDRALDERVAEPGGSRRLMTSILERSDCLSREEFVAISAWQPLIAVPLFSLFARTSAELCDDHLALSHALVGRRRRDRSLVPALRSFWKRLWSMGHLLTLATMGDRGWLVDFLAATRESGLEDLSFSWPLARYGVAPLALRGAWAMGRVGKPLVGLYKGVFGATESPLQLFDAALALGAIGLRHAGPRAEIQKMMAKCAARVDLRAGATECASLRDYCSTVGGGYAHVLNAIFGCRPEGLDDYAVAAGRDAFAAAIARRARQPGGGGPGPFASPADVPEDVARAAFLGADGDYANDPGAALLCLTRLGAVARARPEDFYYPAEVLPFVRERWRPERTLDIFARMDRAYGPKLPRRVPKKPGRNEPCPCASGKKFKRCCSA